VRGPQARMIGGKVYYPFSSKLVNGLRVRARAYAWTLAIWGGSARPAAADLLEQNVTANRAQRGEAMESGAGGLRRVRLGP
jgi:hypothetical protein